MTVTLLRDARTTASSLFEVKPEVHGVRLGAEADWYTKLEAM
jgi:hypothetical protein